MRVQEDARAFNHALDISRVYREEAHEARTAGPSLRSGEPIHQWEPPRREAGAGLPPEIILVDHV